MFDSESSLVRPIPERRSSPAPMIWEDVEDARGHEKYVLDGRRRYKSSTFALLELPEIDTTVDDVSDSDKTEEDSVDTEIAEVLQAIENGRSQGYDEGFAAGYEEGMAKAREEISRGLEEAIATEMPRIHSIASEFEAAMAGVELELGQRLAQLSLAVGEGIAKAHIKQHPEDIIPIIREIIASDSALSGRPKLRIHNADLEVIRAHLEDELTGLGWTIVADATVTPGGCRVTSAEAEADSTWESRVESVRDHVLRLFEHGENEENAE